MEENSRRGYVPSDESEFTGTQLKSMQIAQKDIAYLINRGYEIGKAVTFVGNHYMFSKRQRMALTRATVCEDNIKLRKKKMIQTSSEIVKNQTVFIDGFNVIITLEAALLKSTILLCMDDVLRDLCGLHGTYRVIDKTASAIDLITRKLISMGVNEAVYFLDSPVSNSGRLSQLIMERSSLEKFNAQVYLEKNPDFILFDKENVISGDAIILNRCTSWINLVRGIMKDDLSDVELVDLS